MPTRPIWLSTRGTSTVCASRGPIGRVKSGTPNACNDVPPIATRDGRSPGETWSRHDPQGYQRFAARLPLQMRWSSGQAQLRAMTRCQPLGMSGPQALAQLNASDSQRGSKHFEAARSNHLLRSPLFNTCQRPLAARVSLAAAVALRSLKSVRIEAVRPTRAGVSGPNWHAQRALFEGASAESVASQRYKTRLGLKRASISETSMSNRGERRRRKKKSKKRRLDPRPALSATELRTSYRARDRDADSERILRGPD